MPRFTPGLAVALTLLWAVRPGLAAARVGKLDELRNKANEELAESTQKAARELAESRGKAARELAEARRKAAEEIEKAAGKGAEEEAKAREKAREEVEKAQAKAAEETAKAEAKAEEEREKAEAKAADEIAKAEREFGAGIRTGPPGADGEPGDEAGGDEAPAALADGGGGAAAQGARNRRRLAVPEVRGVRDAEALARAPVAARKVDPQREAGLDRASLRDPLQGRAVIPPPARDGSARVDRHVREAQARNRLKEWSQAEAEADLALAVDPDNVPARAARGEAVYRQGRFVSAEKDALEASDREPQSAFALKLLARARFAKGDYEGAREALLEYLKLNDKDANAYALLAAIEAKRGDVPAAFKALEQAARLNPVYRALLEEARRTGVFRYLEEDEALGLPQPSGAGETPWRLLALAVGLIVLAGAAITFRKPSRGPALTPGRKPVSLESRYEGIRGVSSSADGALLEARDPRLGRLVSIRRVAVERGPQRDAILSRARAWERLEHPAVAKLYEIVEEDRSISLVYEAVGGKSVAAMLAEAGRLPWRQGVLLLEPVCAALVEAHRRGLAHGALAPDRIHVGEQGLPKLAGCSLSAAVDAAADVRALGALLHAMCGGEGPAGLAALAREASSGRLATTEALSRLSAFGR